jgi:hypothetical protein
MMRVPPGLLLLLLLAAGGCFSPLVTHGCPSGLTACGDSCVDLQVSAAHCGACGTPCSGQCQAGQCSIVGERPDAGVDAPADVGVDSAVPDRPADGRDTAVPPPDSRPPDVGADVGRDVTPDRMVDTRPPDTRPPDTQPPDTRPPDTQPPIVCNTGFTACGDRCVFLREDPDHCGSCNNPCSSGFCMAGQCQSQGAGHLVVIGHDYQVTRTGMNNLVGNAVLLSGASPARVLAYEGTALPAAVQGTTAAITEVAASRGRTWTRTVVAAADVPARLAEFDVFLIHAQATSSDAALNQLGQDWATALGAFIASGKTVVLLDGITTSNGGTVKILSSAGLFAGSTRFAVTGETLTVASPGDALALGVPRTYRAETTSAAFNTAEMVKVVQTAAGVAVVVHRVF